MIGRLALPLTLALLAACSPQPRSVSYFQAHQVEAEQATAAEFELYAKESLSALEDLDYAEATGRLQLQLTILQASQQAFASVQGLSLFHYL